MSNKKSEETGDFSFKKQTHAKNKFKKKSKFLPPPRPQINQWFKKKKKRDFQRTFQKPATPVTPKTRTSGVTRSGFRSEVRPRGGSEDHPDRSPEWKRRNTTVDGSEIRRSPVEVGSLSHFLQGFKKKSRMVGRISSINSINPNNQFLGSKC